MLKYTAPLVESMDLKPPACGIFQGGLKGLTTPPPPLIRNMLNLLMPVAAVFAVVKTLATKSPLALLKVMFVI